MGFDHPIVINGFQGIRGRKCRNRTLEHCCRGKRLDNQVRNNKTTGTIMNGNVLSAKCHGGEHLQCVVNGLLTVLATLYQDDGHQILLQEVFKCYSTLVFHSFGIRDQDGTTVGYLQKGEDCTVENRMSINLKVLFLYPQLLGCIEPLAAARSGDDDSVLGKGHAISPAWRIRASRSRSEERRVGKECRSRRW